MCGWCCPGAGVVLMGGGACCCPGGNAVKGWVVLSITL